MVFMLRLRTTLSGWAGAPGLSTFYFRNADGTIPTTAEAQNAFGRVQAAWVQMRPSMPAAWTWSTDGVGDVLLDETGVLAAQVQAGATAGQEGTAAGGFGPAAAGVVVRYNTASVINGHVVRGRTFLSPVGLAADANGTPASNLLNCAVGFGGELATPGGLGVKQVIWHRPVAGAGGEACDVVSSSVKDTFAVLTSRR